MTETGRFRLMHRSGLSLIITIFVICSILTSCRGRLTEENYFLLLKDKETISLNIYDNNKIKEQKTFAISDKSIYATDQKERVAILDTAKNTITLYDIKTSKETELSIPYDIEPRCILLNNDNLFMGGEKYGEIIVQYQISIGRWHQLEIPKEVFLRYKAIDDLVIKDSLLMAIDNEIIPKYILFYQLNATEKLPFSHFKELKSNKPNEDIHQGRITPDYFGLRSNAEFLRGHSQHITIYKGLDLTESFAISSMKRKVIYENNENYHTYNDFLIIGNKVIIASKEAGLGLFEIEDSYFKITSDDIWEKGFNHQISDSAVSYRAYPNKNIIQLTQIPNTTKIILTIENNNRDIKYEIIEI